MKLLTFAAAILAISAALLPPIIGQVAPSQIAPRSVRHIAAAQIDGVRGGARLSAVNIERDLPYPSVVHLKGTVEIRTNGFVLRADEADYDEKTGEVEARGAVKVAPNPELK